MLANFMTEQRDHNRIMNKRQDSIENIVIGPAVLGSTGAPILNGDGLPMRDRSKGLAGRKSWRVGVLSTVVQLLALATAVAVLLNAMPL